MSDPELSIQTQPPCVCHILHENICDSKTCIEAAKSQHSTQHKTKHDKAAYLSEFRKGASKGCSTCSILYDGLTLPEIKSIWTMQGLSDDKVKIFLFANNDKNRVNVRVADVAASYHPVSQWRYFAFNSLSDSVEEPLICRAFPRMLHVSEHTSSETSWSDLKRWIEVCDKEHEGCKRATYIPSRLVDLGLGQEKKGDVRLLSNAEINEGKYTALSYCWGKTPFIKTTTADLEERKQCIKWDALPMTFQDAIIITRTLGIRYIWIDSLCILQDDTHDWEIESSKMSSIYENSYLTIAASHAADSNGGCFHKTEAVGKNSLLKIRPNSNVHIRVVNRDDHNEFSHVYSRKRSPKPLPSRGWALQERLLSPRTIHYTSTELLWECNTQFDCQCGGMYILGQFNWSRALWESKTSMDGRMHTWLLVIEIYTAQSLTVQTDRLPALSGLVQQAKREGWGQYVAGLWSDGLEITTGWEVVDKENASKRHNEYLGPSWSWVNIPGAVAYANYIDDHRFRALLQSLVELRDIRVSTGIDPSGHVAGASMIVSGRGIDAMLTPLPVEAGKPATQQTAYRLKTIPLGYTLARFIPDAPLDHGQKEASGEVKVKLVPWLYYLSSKVEETQMTLLILARARPSVKPVVKPMDQEPEAKPLPRSGAYERIGMYRLGKDLDRWYFHCVPLKDLVLV